MTTTLANPNYFNPTATNNPGVYYSGSPYTGGGGQGLKPNTMLTDFQSFGATDPRAIKPQVNESVEDQIFRLLRDQQNFTRARFNRLGTQSGATSADLLAALEPLRGQLGEIDASKDLLSGLTGQLVSSSLGSTAGASIAAVNSARMADARFGGGGNAAMLASRAATDAAVGQSAALSQALVQGRLGEASYRQNLLANRSGIATALSGLLQQQAGLLEERGRLGVAMEGEIANQLGGAMGAYSGITGSRNSAQGRGPSIFGLN